MVNLYPITAILMFFGILLNARIDDTIFNILFFVFYLSCFIYFTKKHNAFKINPSIFSSIIAFSIIFCWLNSSEPFIFHIGVFGFSMNSLITTIIIVLKMINIVLLIKIIIYASEPSEWAGLLSRLGFRDFLLSISVAFNLIPFLKDIFLDFKRRVFYKNINYFNRVILVLRLPYVLASYSLVYANDVYKAYFSRGFEENPPKYADLKRPDTLNTIIMICLVILFITRL